MKGPGSGDPHNGKDVLVHAENRPSLPASPGREGSSRHGAAPAEGPAHPAGQDLTIDAIYRAHAPAVLRWATRLLGPDGDDVQDVVHEVFMVAQRRLHTFRGDARITTWLYEITMRVALEFRRRRRRWHWFDREDGSARLEWLAAFGPTPGEPIDPHAVLERRRSTAALYTILDRIDEKHRTVLIAYELEGLSGEEIAAITGTRVQNVYLRLSRARRKFMKRYEEWERRHSK
jgi:RNA polymerase sigma-70 factor (ECF subfamily)